MGNRKLQASKSRRDGNIRARYDQTLLNCRLTSSITLANPTLTVQHETAPDITAVVGGAPHDLAQTPGRREIELFSLEVCIDLVRGSFVAGGQ